MGFNNLVLGNGNIESVNIIDECGKVHLNYASAELLRYLMVECGIADFDARVIAQNIVDYRTKKFFDSIEEVKQVKGMTTDYYDLIRDYVTVYSFINDGVFRPTGARAPVNVNTASRGVLEAIFDPLGLGGGVAPGVDKTDASRLAGDIMIRRESQPFTYFESSDPTQDGTIPASNRSDFYGFINGDIPGYPMKYLSTKEKRLIWDNADASISDWGGGNCISTEFSYYSDGFMIDAVGKKSGSTSQVRMVIKDGGDKYLDTCIGDTALTKYWRQVK